MSEKEGNSRDGGDTQGRSVRASGSQSRVELAHKIGATMANITHEDILKFPKSHKPRSEATDDVVKRIESAPDLRKGPTDDLPKIRIGVCAMDKKANSKQMRAITQRLIQFGEFDIIKFGDDTILNKPVEEWPVVQCLLSWHSGGFPLSKAQKYVNLRKPYLINDVFSQDILLDRRKVYRRLVEAGIPVPYHIIVDRDDLPEGKNDPESFVEGEDFVELDGVRINKPFVEKPASGEDHNIYIYYPHSMGGGVKKLFRKIDNKSADYDPKHPGTVRRDGSFIYEEFLTTGGTDVKVYTVGPRYAHAEARKSPVVDGKVQRTADGKEVRYPVLLSPQEKEIARSVCLAFGQRVCGFDLLRSERGRSFVCDVNGWSFVKNSQKYYDDAAGILRMTILSAVAPHRLLIAEAASARPASSLYGDDVTIAPDYMEDPAMRSMHPSESFDDVRSPAAAGEIDSHSRPGEELRCVLAVIRHGDRTPKQKMKIVVTQQPMLDLLHKYLDAKGKQAKLKSPKELQELLDVTRQLLDEMDSSTNKNDNAEADELREKFRIIKTVLEQGGQFAGINRKVQLKPLKWTEKDDERVCTEALLILKHGGVLTHAGRQQAEALGSLFRNVMYPQSGPTGGGLLRLHSTYRHDLKIYSSDEGRVQTSAAAFAKGLLDLEGSSLTPILVSLVNKDAGMLDAFGKGASVDISAAKQELYAQMTYNNETQKSEYAMPEYSKQLQTPPPSPSIDALAPDDASSTSTSGMQSSNGRNSNGSQRQLNLGEPGTFSVEDGPPPEGASNIKGRPHIYPMPADPLKSLRHLSELCKTLVDQLREKCLEEARKDESQEGYSALTMDPNDWQQQPGRPCGGEKMLLMFDRWRKLSKAFFNEKKGFDISKVPDIYDAAKYDSIHNANLGLSGLEDLYNSAKELAAAVIPNEYGLQAIGKLRIGSTICANLLGKLLADLASMRDESMTTAGLQHEDSKARSDFAADLATAMESINMDESPVGGEDDAGDDGDDATMHRLCPTYAQDVNSPLRHVRTRIYFTSESHCHSLVNVLRYCHLGLGNESIIGNTGEAYLHKTSELDYMTHVVLRMFENKSLPLKDPGRFRVELLFSPGAGHNPHEVVPIRKDHVIPIVPRTAIHKGDEGGVTLHELEQATKPYAKPFKRKQDPYLPLKGTPATAHTSEKLDFWI